MLKKLENFPKRGRKRGGHEECWTGKARKKEKRDRSKRVK